MNAAPTTADFLSAITDGMQATVREIAMESEAAATPKVELMRPSAEKFGDYATNVALLLAPLTGSNPRAVGERIAAEARRMPAVDAADVAGPGFVNLTLSDAWFKRTLDGVLDAASRYGSQVVTHPERINLEFVSANPTGMLNVASARHAAFGDSLGRILRFAGHDVATEYYVNDAGKQVAVFGESLLCRSRGEDVPEDGYQGPEISELAEQLEIQPNEDAISVGRRAIDLLLAQVRPQLEQFRVTFDRFQSERELHESGIVAAAVEQIAEMGQTYQQDGATFVRTTSYGDDRDRAVIRSNGVPTYYAADIGYLLHKFRRGFARALLVLGADHHGYIARLKAAAQALGHDADACEVVIMQMVQLVEGGEQKRMSKRRGDVVSLANFVDRIGVDAARFFLLQRSHDQQLDIDLDLAVERDNANPVYYVQYAHARIRSIERAVEAEIGSDVAGLIAAYRASGCLPGQLDPAERRLIKKIAEFPQVVAVAAERRSPHRITGYVHELASDFTKFYRDCRVIGDGIEQPTTAFRIAVCQATRQILATSLDLVGVEAPDEM